jgi:hypothetical protein
MKPVYQSKFGTGQGNCLQAAVASILECGIEDVPDFNMSGIGWFEEMTEWAMKEGHGLAWAHENFWRKHLLINAWCIGIYDVEGTTEKHALVCKAVLDEINTTDRHDSKEWNWLVEVVHDPNVKNPPRTFIKELLFIIPSRRTK